MLADFGNSCYNDTGHRNAKVHVVLRLSGTQRNIGFTQLPSTFLRLEPYQHRQRMATLHQEYRWVSGKSAHPKEPAQNFQTRSLCIRSCFKVFMCFYISIWLYMTVYGWNLASHGCIWIWSVSLNHRLRMVQVVGPKVPGTCPPRTTTTTLVISLSLLPSWQNWSPSGRTTPILWTLWPRQQMVIGCHRHPQDITSTPDCGHATLPPYRCEYAKYILKYANETVAATIVHGIVSYIIILYRWWEGMPFDAIWLMPFTFWTSCFILGGCSMEVDGLIRDTSNPSSHDPYFPRFRRPPHAGWHLCNIRHVGNLYLAVSR